MKCSICSKEFNEPGNNSSPLKRGKCCDACNAQIVIPLRIYLSSENKTHALLIEPNSIISYMKIDGVKDRLRLFYKADNLKYIYVEIESVGKTEISFGVLQCSIAFDKLSMWLSKVSHTISVNDNTYNKVYPFKYPYTYSSSFNGEITVVNNGCIKAPVRIEIIGKTNYPVVEIIKDGVVVSKMRLLVITSNANDSIVVNAQVTEQEMTLIKNGVATDVYQFQDFTCDNFLFLGVGTYKIRFSPGVSEYSICKFQFLEMYEGN